MEHSEKFPLQKINSSQRVAPQIHGVNIPCGLVRVLCYQAPSQVGSSGRGLEI